MHHGIYVDIFLLHGAPPTFLNRKLSMLALSYITIKRLSNNHYKRRRAFLPILAVLRWFPKGFLVRTCLKRIYRYGTDGVNLLLDTGSFGKAAYASRDIFYPVRRVLFLGVSLCVPREAEVYLERKYGNWKIAPDIESINRSHHAVIWDESKDFREYVSNINDFSDE
jgi:lipopolysaccharide cholinephosphotransferase